MASEVWLSLTANERNLLRQALTSFAREGNFEEAMALSRKLERTRIDNENTHARIFAEGGKMIALSKQEYGIIESALEWRSSDLNEEIACSVDPEYTALRTEAALAEKIWSQL